MFNLATKSLLFVVCPAAFIVGFLQLTDYTCRPGRSEGVKTDLNLISRSISERTGDLLAEQNSSTPGPLFLFYHPHCPCTSATVRNLERIRVHLSNEQSIIAFAFCAPDQRDSWIESALTKKLRSIRGTSVLSDQSGKICREFGVRTSGHMLMYDAGGRLLFSGGITPGRGHEGDCDATAQLLKTIDGSICDLSQWPVYGCTIIEHKDQ